MHLEVPPPHLVVWNITKVGAENSNVYSRGRASNKRKGSVGWGLWWNGGDKPDEMTGLSSSWRKQWLRTLAWKILWMVRLVGCSPWGRWELDTTERLHFHFSLSCIGQEMATHSSVLAWRIPGMEKPGGLPSMGLHRVGHDWSNLAAAATHLWSLIAMHKCKPWIPTV